MRNLNLLRRGGVVAVSALVVAGGLSGAVIAYAQEGAPATQVVAPLTVEAQLAAATTAQQVNDIVAVASEGKTPAQIAQIVSLAVASHPNMVTSIVSASAADHPEAATQVASAAVGALPAGAQAGAAAIIVSVAATAAKVSVDSIASVVAANNPKVGASDALASNARTVDVTNPIANVSNTASTAPVGTQSASRDTLSSFTPTATTDNAPSSSASTSESATTSVEPPASDPSKGGSASPV